ncbi:MAG: hypothetical protein HY690_05455 [Chloroflexi bacterium]|nr:hypothetical protein [Chloroflexota bacterium]
MQGRTTERISVTPPAALRQGIRAHAAELGLSPDTPLARAIIELAEEGYQARLRRAAEQAMERVYAAWADDSERAEANAAARAHADEAGLF